MPHNLKRAAPSWRVVEAAWRDGSASCVGCKHRADAEAGSTVSLGCAVAERGENNDFRKCPALKVAVYFDQVQATPAAPILFTMPKRAPRDLFDTVAPIGIGATYMQRTDVPLLSLTFERLQRALLNPATHPGMKRSFLSRIVGNLWALS